MTKLAIVVVARLAVLTLCIFFPAGCGCLQHYSVCDDPDPPPPFCVPEKIRVALVLGSGGVRGMAHVGVIEVLEEAGIPIDLIVGCSAGSIVGALYADNPCVEEIKSAVWQMKSSTLLDFDLLHCRYGLSQGRTMCRVLDQYLTAETFDELQIPLILVASDLFTGELVPMGAGDLVESIRASCSMPFFYVPVELHDRVLVDGGTINPVPTRIARDLGADFIIAVDLVELLDRTFPSHLIEVAERSAEIAFMWQNERCTRWADVVIRPRTCGVGCFDDKMKYKLYLAGRQAAEDHLPCILEKLADLRRENNCGWRTVQLECYTPKVCLSD